MDIRIYPLSSRDEDMDVDEFLLWGWDHDTRTHPTPLPSLIPIYDQKIVDQYTFHRGHGAKFLPMPNS